MRATLRKFLSRKFLVFLVGTAGLFTGYIPSEHWVVLALGYAGIEGVLDWTSLRSPYESTPTVPGEKPPGDAQLF